MKTDESDYAIERVDTASRSSPIVPCVPFAKYFERLVEAYTIKASLCWDIPLYATSQLMDGLAQAYYASRPDQKPTIQPVRWITSRLPCLTLLLACNNHFWLDCFLQPSGLEEVTTSRGKAACEVHSSRQRHSILSLSRRWNIARWTGHSCESIWAILRPEVTIGPFNIFLEARAIDNLPRPKSTP